MIKGSKGALLEHAVGNAMVFVPVLWERLRATERWQVGQAYAESTAAGNRVASAGLKAALQSVRGFDYVPETLRSGAFTEVAARVLSAHFAANNYYLEQQPMQALADLVRPDFLAKDKVVNELILASRATSAVAAVTRLKQKADQLRRQLGE